GWPFVTALICLDADVAPTWAKARGLPPQSLLELTREPAVRSELEALVASINGRLSRAEQIKRFEVVTEAWGPATGELTPTLKLKRRVILKQYAERIATFYENA
ncbi:long-chain fatty acid--CoA ligase, partial [Corallococcus sp. AB038B]